MIHVAGLIAGDSMPKVRVRYFGELRDILNAKDEEYEVKEGATLTDLILSYIPERHEKDSKRWKETVFRMVRGEIAMNNDGTPVLRNYLILIRGKSPSLGYMLGDGDEIVILPPSGGG